MQKKTVKAGIVGAGFAASFHLEAMKKVYGANLDLRGVYSPGQERLATFTAVHGLKACDNLEALLDEVDVIHVCAPTHVHESIALAALERDIYAIVEKPLTGYFGDGSPDFRGDTFPKQQALDFALKGIGRIMAAEGRSKGRILYAENWVYAPAIQKEREILEKTKGQILWMHGEESHSGSHSQAYGYWKCAGGGSMMSKGCHPLSAALYLKQVEGRARLGGPIRPASVTGRTHALTRTPGFQDEGHIRKDYFDIEDFSLMHVVFEDGTVADILASDIVLGGVHNWIEVNANNHRAICNINPNTAMQTYNPEEANFQDIYVVEKTGTKQGWAHTSPEEDWFTGYSQEIEAFYRTVAYDEPVESNAALGADTVAVIYSAYVSAEQNGAEVKVKTVTP
jgi:predicted dehydrogenase